MEGKEEPCLDGLSLCLSNPAFGFTPLNGQDWVLGPSRASRWLVLSHPADLPLSVASATDIAEVLLEMVD